MSTCIFVQILLRDLIQLPSDILGNVFDDLGIRLVGSEMVAEEGLVEGEDAFDFDAKGDLEGRVDHVECKFRV